MKKLSLLLALTGFSVAASAQQGNFFDIQKYIKKKNEQNKKLTIDNLFIRPKNKCWKSTNLPFSKKGLQRLEIRTKTNILTKLSNGDIAYSLPQDNMPCIVPDISKLNYFDISNLAKYPNTFIIPDNKPGNIPNVATPKKIIILR